MPILNSFLIIYDRLSKDNTNFGKNSMKFQLFYGPVIGPQ